MLIKLKNRKKPQFIPWCQKLASKIINKKDNRNCSCGELSHQQISLLESLRKNKHTVIKSYRVAGLSMLMNLSTIYRILYDDKNSIHKELYIYPSTSGLIESKNKFKTMLEECEEEIYIVDEDNSYIKLMFEGNISIIHFVGQVFAAKFIETDYDCINIDDAAWIAYNQVLKNCLKTAGKYNPQVVIGSTANKEEGFFYELWNKTINGGTDFTPISLKWYLDPRFNENLKAGQGLEDYNVDNIGMICDALERKDIITNKWYENKTNFLGRNLINEIDGNFLDY